MDMAGRSFTFVSGAGSPLSGHLEPPEGTPRGWAIFAHCFTCGKDSHAAVRISRALSRAGIGVLRFDFAGTGTQGMGGALSFLSDVEDLRAAAQAMAAAGMSPSLLVGHSLGGAASIMAAAELPDVAAVATIGAPAELEHILQNLRPDEVDAIRREGEASVDIAGRSFLIRRSFLEAVEKLDVETCMAALRRPVLILHSPVDQVVGLDHASRLFGASKHPKSFISLDDADHLLSRRQDAAYVANVIAAWAGRYIGGTDPYLVNYVQIGDFAGIDEKSWQARYDLNFASYGIPGLSLMTRYVNGDNIDRGSNVSEGQEWERDTDIAYAFQDEALKGLAVKWRNATYRSNLNKGTKDLDENRLIISYTTALW